MFADPAVIIHLNIDFEEFVAQFGVVHVIEKDYIFG
jgi:hypothetical protein